MRERAKALHADPRDARRASKGNQPAKNRLARPPRALRVA